MRICRLQLLLVENLLLQPIEGSQKRERRTSRINTGRFGINEVDGWMNG